MIATADTELTSPESAVSPTGDTSGPLSVAERQDLALFEETIEEGKAAFLRVGHALLQIRDGRLYREEYSSFKEYCGDRWGFSSSHAYRIIEAAEVVKSLSAPQEPTEMPEREPGDETEQVETSPVGDTRGGPATPVLLPTSERQTRPLGRVKDITRRRKVWQEAVETAPKDGRGQPVISESHIEKTAAEVEAEEQAEAEYEIALARIGKYNAQYADDLRSGARSLDREDVLTLGRMENVTLCSALRGLMNGAEPQMPQSSSGRKKSEPNSEFSANFKEMLADVGSLIRKSDDLAEKVGNSPAHEIVLRKAGDLKQAILNWQDLLR